MTCEYEGEHALLDVGDDLLSGCLTWEHHGHSGICVFVQEGTSQVYLPRRGHVLRISREDRLAAVALTDLVKRSGWDAVWESPWDYTGG